MYKIYVGCLPACCSKDQLLSYFSCFGNIKNAKVLRKSKKLCSGNGVLLCGDLETFSRILSHRTFSMSGRSIFCEPLLRGEQLQQKNKELSERRVFLSNIPPYMNDTAIEQLLSRFGAVQNAYRIRTLNDEKKPFGFVTFYDSESASKAVKERKLYYQDKKIYVSDFQKNKTPVMTPYPSKNEINIKKQNICTLKNQDNVSYLERSGIKPADQAGPQQRIYPQIVSQQYQITTNTVNLHESLELKDLSKRDSQAVSSEDRSKSNSYAQNRSLCDNELDEEGLPLSFNRCYPNFCTAIFNQTNNVVAQLEPKQGHIFCNEDEAKTCSEIHTILPTMKSYFLQPFRNLQRQIADKVALRLNRYPQNAVSPATRLTGVEGNTHSRELQYPCFTGCQI